MVPDDIRACISLFVICELNVPFVFMVLDKMLFVLIEGEIMSQSNKLMYTTKSRAVVYEGLVGTESAWRI